MKFIMKTCIFGLKIWECTCTCALIEEPPLRGTTMVDIGNCKRDCDENVRFLENVGVGAPLLTQ